MSYASEQSTLPEIPISIKRRLVPYRVAEIEEPLRALEHWRPGLFAVMERMIGVLESDTLVTSTSVDIDEETSLMPVTIWAESKIALEEREVQLLRFHGISEDTLNGFADLVLVAVM